LSGFSHAGHASEVLDVLTPHGLVYKPGITTSLMVMVPDYGGRNSAHPQLPEEDHCSLTRTFNLYFYSIISLQMGVDNFIKSGEYFFVYKLKYFYVGYDVSQVAGLGSRSEGISGLRYNKCYWLSVSSGAAALLCR